MGRIKVVLGRNTCIRVVPEDLTRRLPELGDLGPDAFDWKGGWFRVWDAQAGYGWAERIAHRTLVQGQQKADVWFHFYVPLAYKGRELTDVEVSRIEDKIEATLHDTLRQESEKRPGTPIYGVARMAPDYMLRDLEGLLEKL